MCLGFAAMLVFLKPAKEENGQYFGQRGTEYYPITDDNAAIFAAHWQIKDRAEMVKAISADKRLWEIDLTTLPGFSDTVTGHLQSLLHEGVLIKEL
jgi:tagaturonate reductase